MITVVVIEPYTLLRSGIVGHLAKAVPKSKLVSGDYSDLSDDAPAIQTDLVLLSVLLSENASSLLTAARRVYEPKSILLLTDPGAPPDTWHNLSHEVAGYVSRDASPDILAAAVRLVLAGGNCFQKSQQAGVPAAKPLSRLEHDRAILPVRPTSDNPLRRATDRVGNDCARATDLSPPASAALNEAQMLSITPRQYEVLLLLARGYPAKAISRKLNISAATVKVHTDALYQRLRAHNRNQAVYAAFSLGATLGWNHLHRNPGPPRASPYLHEHS